MNTWLTERHTAAAREVTAIGGLWATAFALDALSRDISTARRYVNRKEASLINLRTKIEDCLCASNLCSWPILSAVTSRLATFLSTLYEACRAKVMYLRCYNDCNVDTAMAALHGQPLAHRGGVDAVRRWTQFSFVTHPWESYSGSADPHGSPSEF